MADELDWESVLVWIDDRFEYNEKRMIAFTPQIEILYFVAFVDRAQVRKIGFRFANSSLLPPQAAGPALGHRRQGAQRRCGQLAQAGTRSP